MRVLQLLALAVVASPGHPLAQSTGPQPPPAQPAQATQPPQVAQPPPASRPTPRAEGAIVTNEGHSELLGRVWRKGDRVELPEGYLRVEEDAHAGDERGVGSFTVVAEAAPPAPEGGTGSAGGAPEEPAPAATDLRAERQVLVAVPCRDERSAYLAELWRSWGVEIRDPGAFLEGLAGGDARLAFAWLAVVTDPVRPLAWSSGLRQRADSLAACMRDRR